LPVAQAICAESQQAEQMPREKIALALLAGHVEPVLSPGAIKKGDDPVIENIQKISRRGVVKSQTLDQERSVGIGKNSLGPGQAHEIHSHVNRLLGPVFARAIFTVGVFARPVHRLDLAGGKCQRGMHAKTRDLVLRMGKLSNRRPLGEKALEQTHRLEEIKRERLTTELLGDFRRG
jgi:hypothetical protein